MLLIDTGPDLRLQALRENIRRVDAVLYTHVHADHLNGIDDLRAFCQLQKKQIPLYGNAHAIENISSRFSYALREPGGTWDIPILKAYTIDNPFDFGGTRIVPIPVKHGRSSILGWRVGNFAYLTDISEIPPESMPLLQNLDVLLLDCLRYQPHHTHINVEQSIAYAGHIAARATYFIHMTHEIEYVSLQQTLPSGMFVGYDGLRLPLA